MSIAVPSKELGKDRHTQRTIFRGSGTGNVPDPKITLQENQYLQEKLSLASLNLQEYDVPVRPSYGKAAKANTIDLWTNYFHLTVNPAQKIYRYHVQIDPEILSARKRRQLFKNAFEEIAEFQQLGNDLATDYKTIFVTARKLDLGDTYTKVFKQTYHEDIGQTARANAIRYSLTVTLTADFPLERLTKVIDARPTDPINFSVKENAIQALNIIMANYPNRQDDIFQSGQNKFFPYPRADAYPKFDLQGGLIGVRGYYSSVRCATSRILLNVNAQCSPFYKAVNLAELMREVLEHVKRATKEESRQWRAVERFIEGLRIKVQALKSPSESEDGQKAILVQERVLTVKGLAYMRRARIDKDGKQTRDQWDGKPDVKPSNARNLAFPYTEIRGDVSISVEHYYEKRYGYRIKHATDGFYVVECGALDKPLWIPAELGIVMPGQAYREKLDDTQTSRMLTIAAVPPGDNARRIVAEDGGLGTLGVLPQHGPKSRSPALAPFGIQINANMLVVEGRVLQPPTPMYGNSKVPTMYPGSWSSTQHRLAVPKTLPKWAVMRIGNVQFEERQFEAFKKAFNEAGLKHEDSFSPDIRPIVTNPQNSASLDKMFGRLEGAGIQLLLVILPSKDKPLYHKMKFLGDCGHGIHTIAVQTSKINDINTKADYYANVALKVNLKCGGTNHILGKGDLDLLSKGETMIVGMDVTHPASEHMKGAPSIAAIVSSVGADFGQWPASLRCQKSRQEIIEDLYAMMIEHLTLWMSSNHGKKPRSILIYRDGVSEGQYTEVQRKELEQVRAACDFIYGDGVMPKITVVVVGKRHHTRFYPTREKNAEKRNGLNSLPGTVVDRGITTSWLWDFYLQPHAAIKGTARPGHYVVLLDEIGFKADQLEKVTHNLCYLFGRATKAVSVVPPVYYADLACTRGRAYLAEYLSRPWPRGTKFGGAVADGAPWKQGVHDRLKNTMFYV